MAEAERIIGTPDTPDTGRDGTEGDDARAGGAPGAGAREGGAPVAASGPGETAAQSERPRGKRRIAVLFTVAALAYALDLISKMIVVAELEHHEPVEIIGDWLRFEAIRNAGAAFGFGEAFTVIFTVIAAVVIVVIIRLARKLYSLPWAIALGLLLGGALGNLTDRIFRSPGVFEGAVVDFIAPKGFAVFNLADSAIVCGGILIVLLSFRGLDPDGTVHKD
ncbi:signal peptidase [Streptomyces viridosporus ATCC 14672]|uniref:Lipoprotein signal peptidase n=1 Tax=Streptomyces viridosporus (strain ATCC 14672 / DSM 40746 / JCM 4963 / KCTC 9882 / NRRL B-12104 / FH 1290) TaxID=566461 RepID=D6A9K5_STRV1|nr:signal peptidase II [Streptomyces viridosporus]EFE70039.1 signal peptidase [Streptomyces viridosporus ATCC 14672]